MIIGIKPKTCESKDRNNNAKRCESKEGLLFALLALASLQLSTPMERKE